MKMKVETSSADRTEPVTSTRAPEQVRSVPDFRKISGDLLAIGFAVGRLGFVEQQEALGRIAGEIRRWIGAPTLTKIERNDQRNEQRRQRKLREAGFR